MRGRWSRAPRLGALTKTAGTLAASTAFRKWGKPRLLPVNLTASVTYRCNFRCSTCNVYERRAQELSAEEWDKVFASLGTAPRWITFSGGEPFLRMDLADIVSSAVRRCRPAIVNIPTNGWFTDRIAPGVERMARDSRDTQFVVNLSVDHHVPERHDEIRGAPGSYARVGQTMDVLRSLALPNLTIGVHTVVSTANQNEFPDIVRGLRTLRADSYIAEPAERREELRTLDADIPPSGEAFRRAAGAILAEGRSAATGVVARIALAARREYYRRVADLLDGDVRAMPVCHAGFLSAHIGADGDVWSCCVLARSLGNLRQTGLDFSSVWFSKEAEEFRIWMRERRCACPLANAAYTNMLAEPATALRVAARSVRRDR